MLLVFVNEVDFFITYQIYGSFQLLIQKFIYLFIYLCVFKIQHYIYKILHISDFSMDYTYEVCCMAEELFCFWNIVASCCSSLS